MAMQPATRGNRIFLYVAGLFNLVVGLMIVVLARSAPDWLGLEVTSTSQLLYVDLFAVVIIGFGAGYALGGRDLARFWPFVALGALAKAAVVLVVFPYVLSGHASPLTAVLASGDAIYVLMFVRLLRARAIN